MSDIEHPTPQTTERRVKLFAQLYVTGLSAAQAARRAGYSASSAKNAAQWLIGRADVNAAIERERVALTTRTDELSPLWVLSQLKLLALDAKVESNKLRALELIGKHLTMFSEAQPHTGAVSTATVEALAQFSVEQLRLIAQGTAEQRAVSSGEQGGAGQGEERGTVNSG